MDDSKKKVIYIGSRLRIDARMLKYGIVGCSGIAVNLATMALFLTIGFGRGWVPSAIASVISTTCNFIFHNRWTFSDRQHQGLGWFGDLSRSLWFRRSACLLRQRSM